MALSDGGNEEEQFFNAGRTSSASWTYRLKVRSMAVGQSDCFDGRLPAAAAADGGGGGGSSRPSSSC